MKRHNHLDGAPLTEWCDPTCEVEYEEWLGGKQEEIFRQRLNDLHGWLIESITEAKDEELAKIPELVIHKDDEELGKVEWINVNVNEEQP